MWGLIVKDYSMKNDSSKSPLEEGAEKVFAVFPLVPLFTISLLKCMQTCCHHQARFHRLATQSGTDDPEDLGERVVICCLQESGQATGCGLGPTSGSRVPALDVGQKNDLRKDLPQQVTTGGEGFCCYSSGTTLYSLLSTFTHMMNTLCIITTAVILLLLLLLQCMMIMIKRTRIWGAVYVHCTL
jgi:hypothetical protein